MNIILNQITYRPGIFFVVLNNGCIPFQTTFSNKENMLQGIPLACIQLRIHLPNIKRIFHPKKGILIRKEENACKNYVSILVCKKYTTTEFEL